MTRTIQITRSTGLDIERLSNRIGNPVILKILREWFTDKSTCGNLYLDDVWFCYTLEPRKDQSLGKPYCIPTGTYSFILQYSPRFKMTTPHLLDVPGFTNIEIHPGNYPIDTEGCLLVGSEHQENMVTGSRSTFDKLISNLLTVENSVQAVEISHSPCQS